MASRPTSSRARRPCSTTCCRSRVSTAFAAGDEADVPYLVGTTDLELPDATLDQVGPETRTVWRDGCSAS